MQQAQTTPASILHEPFWLAPPDAPNARLVCATVRPELIDPRLSAFEPADVAGCDLDPDIALARCEGEAIEYLSQMSPDNDPLNRDGQVALRDLATGRTEQLPAEQILRIAGRETPNLGSGCAAGRTLDEAMLAGLWELIERDAVTRWWHDGTSGHALEPAFNAAALRYVGQLRGEAHDRRTWLIDISTRPELPVIVACSMQAESGFVAGMAGHPNAGIAAEKALRELVQMEVGLQFTRYKQQREMPLNAVEERMVRRAALPRSHAPLSDLPQAVSHPSADGDTASLLAQTVVSLGSPVLAAELTRKQFGLPVAKLIVPALRPIPDETDWVAVDPDNRVALF